MYNYCSQSFLNIWDEILAIKVRKFSVLNGEVFLLIMYTAQHWGDE